MGSPTSSILSEIYLKYVENKAMYDILKRNNITGYFRYLDDIEGYSYVPPGFPTTAVQ
jgi:hypothetical protein